MKNMRIPKPTTKIRQDERGLFVRTNGAKYRPVRSKYSYPVMQPKYFAEWIAAAPSARVTDELDRTYAYDPDPTLFSAGEAVCARHINQTPSCRVTAPDGRAAIWWVEDTE